MALLTPSYTRRDALFLSRRRRKWAMSGLIGGAQPRASIGLAMGAWRGRVQASGGQFYVNVAVPKKHVEFISIQFGRTG